MIESTGSIWDQFGRAVVVPTNGVVSNGRLIMGAGVALQAKNRFQELPALLGSYVTKHGNRAFYCRNQSIISFPTKNNWWDDSSLPLIEQSLVQLVEIVNKFDILRIAMPQVGCGLGKLDWTRDVRPLCVKALDSRFTVFAPK